jgi:hypothetical protein
MKNVLKLNIRLTSYIILLFSASIQPQNRIFKYAYITEVESFTTGHFLVRRLALMR